MTNRNERLCVRDVVKVDRFTRTGGGKMRPTLNVFYKCVLTCGHVVERRKGKTYGFKPPVRMACPECREAKAQALDEQP